jgi:hypothetical protein
MTKRCTTLGEAKRLAAGYATRDGCKWNVYFVDSGGAGMAYPYMLLPEFEEPRYPSFIAKLVATVAPQVKKPDSKSLALTHDELKLAEFILRKDDDRQLIADGVGVSDEASKSLWQKVKKMLG